MTTLVQRRPNSLTDLLNTWFDNGPGFGLAPSVRVEDYVEDDVYVLRAELRGIDPDKDVTIDVDGDTLTIGGERTEEEKDKSRHELHYGSFTRSVTLPRGFDAGRIRAEYKDGVLELHVPLNGGVAQPYRVPIARAAS